MTASIGSKPTPSADEGEGSIEALSTLCDGSPGAAAPRIALARALLLASRAAEALIPAEQALALAPELAAAIEAREAVVAALKAGDPALVTLEMAAVLDPDDAGAQLMLGEAYAALDRPHDAERHFKRALALGRAREAHADLASLYLSVAMLDAAEHHAKAVLAGEDRGAADDAAVAMAHQTLAGVAEARGDPAAAAQRLDQAYARQSLYRQPVAGASFTTLILATRHQGNVPHASLMPPHTFDRAIWYMEHARPDQFDALPPHAVVLNAIGDPDIALASAAIVEAFLRRCARPVLNPPHRIAATFRHRIGETLAGLEGVIVPRASRLRADAIAAEGLAAAIARAGLEAPVLVRPTGSHGGAGLRLASNARALAEIEIAAGADVYVSQFHDYRSPDGYYRKYRVIFVAGRPFPYHLAIGRHWMVHHQSAEMADDPARRAEELDFLRDPTGAIGAPAMTALEAIGARLGLDYGGIDFGVTDEGQVLVFEANATMLTHLEREDGPFAAKNPFIQPIIDAFQARLKALASAPAA